ncbi:growth hormone-inducible transmembrane protein [Hemiscyllium ocellatum]|uniref:growth hormone-inducible transmembrane protein n=1 Tax=Hemiscyllium ocellatum TaxID=170820 RepID=UPI002966E207|nr:growth hormone-inducible transmembrane protein [Hemiscyllium ocellatum]XP_060710258.1 growth hormone-inducible transmembrane protein [Hemiscyllium ocellatum]XP_060710259.1 growth hormone-inducible transmembrane protein [Hemiscyllium ocellatum]
MLAARFTCLRPVLTQGGPAWRSYNLKSTQRLLQPKQNYATKSRVNVRRTKTMREKMKEAVLSPSLETAARFDSTGRLFVAGGAAVGLGALCYYGLGMSNEIGAIEKAVIWPQYVKDRIRSTYMYFSGGIGLTALSAVAISRSPAIMNLMMKNSFLAIGASFAAMIGAGVLVRSIPYEEGLNSKHLAWILHSGVMGAIVAPMVLLGGPILMRAAWYTVGIVGGLSTVAMCAPSEKFLHIGGPLAVGLGLVFASSIGSVFLPPSSVFGAGLYSVAVYGGLVLFGMFLLYDTQKVIKRAEMYPMYGVRKFDPINACMGIYMDTLNIFIRVAAILSNSGTGRKK